MSVIWVWGLPGFPASGLKSLTWRLANTAIYRTGATLRSKSQLQPHSKPLCTQNHCSSLTQSHCAL